MIWKANCKINIGLDVLRRRADGYHDLETVMVPVRALCDRVEVERTTESGCSFSQQGIEVDCPEEQNICVKAFRLMASRHGVDGVRITLDKRIPFGAGLGGGSADGTMVLLALNELFELHLAEEELIALAAELGSDTAFFVRNSPQLCTGRGVEMTPIELKSLNGLWLLLVKPDEGVSTREAYAGVRPAVPELPLRERLAEPIARWQQVIKNDFESSVFAAHPRLAQIKEQLLAQGARYAAMSGSGSTLFGLFDQEPSAHPFEGLFTHCERLEF